MKKILLLFFVLFFCYELSYSQFKHIKYNKPIYYIDTSFKRDSIDTQKHNLYYKKCDGIYNIIVLDKNKCLVYESYNDMLESNNDEENKIQSIYVTIYDKRKKSFAHIDFYYHHDTDTIKFGTYKKYNWVKFSQKNKVFEDNMALIQKVYDEQNLESEKIDFSNCKLKVINTGKIKNIHGFDCENIVIKDCFESYNLWVTKEFAYNWAFELYINNVNKIPGTVIQQLSEDRPFFDFIEIKDLDYSDIIFNQDHLKEVLSKWN